MELLPVCANKTKVVFGLNVVAWSKWTRFRQMLSANLVLLRDGKKRDLLQVSMWTHGPNGQGLVHLHISMWSHGPNGQGLVHINHVGLDFFSKCFPPTSSFCCGTAGQQKARSAKTTYKGSPLHDENTNTSTAHISCIIIHTPKVQAKQIMSAQNRLWTILRVPRNRRNER